jgi:hypothetical protein
VGWKSSFLRVFHPHNNCNLEPSIHIPCNVCIVLLGNPEAIKFTCIVFLQSFCWPECCRSIAMDFRRRLPILSLYAALTPSEYFLWSDLPSFSYTIIQVLTSCPPARTTSYSSTVTPPFAWYKRRVVRFLMPPVFINLP